MALSLQVSAYSIVSLQRSEWGWKWWNLCIKHQKKSAILAYIHMLGKEMMAGGVFMIIPNLDFNRPLNFSRKYTSRTFTKGGWFKRYYYESFFHNQLFHKHDSYKQQ